VPGGRPQTRYRLSLGGRPKGLADHAELLVARLLGRNLNKREGCLVQLLAIVIVGVVIYWFFSSDLYVTLIRAFSEWYAHQFKLPGAPTPTPGS